MMAKMMAKPPNKALQQIKSYCEKTQCRRCYFGYRQGNDFVACRLMDAAPCEWDVGQAEEVENERD